MVLNAFGQVLIRPADLIYTGLSLVGTKRTSRPPSAPRTDPTLTPSSQYTPTRSSPRESDSPTGTHSPTHSPAHPTPPQSPLPNRLNSRQSLRDQAVRDICGTEIFGSRLQPARTPFDSTIAIGLPDIPEQYRGESLPDIER